MPTKCSPTSTVSWIRYALFSVVFCAFFSAHSIPIKANDWQIIESKHLGYELQYQIDFPPINSNQLLIAFDGHFYQNTLNLTQLALSLNTQKRILAPNILYIDSRNPSNLSENRRNKEFMCNERYLNFVFTELIPNIESQYSKAFSKEDTTVLGVSFGALNCLCIAIWYHPYVKNIALNSPASDRHLNFIIDKFEQTKEQSLNFMITVGKTNDNTKTVRRLKDTLKKMGYSVEYLETKGTHNQETWSKHLPHVLEYFYSTDQFSKNAVN